MKKNTDTRPSLLHLFSIFFRVGAFTFGGGFAMIPIMQREFVDKQGWLAEEDFVDMIGLTQSAPGPVAVNSAVYLGYILRGIPGAIVSVLGTAMPSLLIILAIAWALSRYSLDILQQAFNGIRPVVVSLIAFAAYKLGIKVLKKPSAYVITAVATILVAFLGIHPVPLIIAGAAIGLWTSSKKQGEVQ